MPLLALRAAFSARTRLVLLNTPHNPTGKVFSREELELVAGLALEFGALVVTDEAKWPRAPLIDLGPVAYFRLRRGYTRKSLEPWVELVRSAVATHHEVHVYFKHDSQSPALAQRLLKLAGKESVSR